MSKRPPTSATEEVEYLIADYRRKVEAQQAIYERFQCGTDKHSQSMRNIATDNIMRYENKISELQDYLGGVK